MSLDTVTISGLGEVYLEEATYRMGTTHFRLLQRQTNNQRRKEKVVTATGEKKCPKDQRATTTRN